MSLALCPNVRNLETQLLSPSDWSLCIKSRGWPTARQRQQASSSSSNSRALARWTSAPRCSSTSSSSVRSRSYDTRSARSALSAFEWLTSTRLSRCIKSSARVPRNRPPGEVFTRGRGAGAHQELSAALQRTLWGKANASCQDCCRKCVSATDNWAC